MFQTFPWQSQFQNQCQERLEINKCKTLTFSTCISLDLLTLSSCRFHRRKEETLDGVHVASLSVDADDIFRSSLNEIGITVCILSLYWTPSSFGNIWNRPPSVGVSGLILAKHSCRRFDGLNRGRETSVNGHLQDDLQDFVTGTTHVQGAFDVLF